VDQLRDIKGLMIIDDYSLYIFIALIIGLLVFLYLIIKFIVKFLRKNTPIKIAKKKLKEVDLNDTKQSAYTITKYAPFLNQEEDFSYLEKYKYKKESLEFLQEDKENLERFLKNV
jgi:uncharacterized protein YneF (UPF0154 family)